MPVIASPPYVFPLSVPSIVVIHSVVGFKKTAVFVGLVVMMSTVAGMVFGAFFV